MKSSTIEVLVVLIVLLGVVVSVPFIPLPEPEFDVEQLDSEQLDEPRPTESFLQVTSEQLAASKKELKCLAENIYHEARGEGEKGMYAVAQVTLNRLKVGYWGSTICRVVYARAQFSWTLDRNLKEPQGRMWIESKRIANRVLNGERVPSLKTALFYHADYVDPNWRHDRSKIQKIGAHIFYARAKGSSLKVQVD